MIRATLFVPFAYFHWTRLRPEPARYLLTAMNEWIPAMAILWLLGGHAPVAAVTTFLLAYLAFISVYEIGYIANDLLAFREEGGRSRLGTSPPPAAMVAAAILLRIGVFYGLSTVLGVEGSTPWWLFYGLLALVFTAHSVLTAPGLRAVTFIHLATSRFFAPIFAFAAQATTALLVAPVFLAYVVPRLLAYLESKDVLHLPGRAGTGFKVGYYLVLAAPMALLALWLESWVPLVLNAYYLLGWTLAMTLGLGRDRAARGD